MCGIFGIVRHDGGPLRAGRIERMADVIRHRGPDNTGIHQEPDVALGNNRLAIIDVATGNQPIYNEDESLCIVFNGEIYNYRALRTKLVAKGHVFRTKGDTEVILHAFEEYGERCVDHLNGMYAFAIWNIPNRSLFLARDRLGIKPLYLAELDGEVAFASEPKALLDLMPDGARPDWASLGRFFSLGYFALDDCAFEGISRFPAAHFAWLNSGNIEFTRFWRPTYGMGESVPIQEIVPRVGEIVSDTLEIEMESDEPVGVFLSGGLDSSLVALYAQRHSHGRMPSFSLGFEEATHDESDTARDIAKCFGLDHHAFRMSQQALTDSLFNVAAVMDEPFGDSTVLPLLILSQYTRHEVKVVLSGWGGDELFAGYPTYKAHSIARRYRHLPALLTRQMIPAVVNRLPVSDKYMSFEFKAKRFIKGVELSPEAQHFIWMGYMDDAWKADIFQPQIARQMGGTAIEKLAPVIDALEEPDIVSRIMHLDALTFLEGNGLFQADRMTMAASLEARVPLLNNDLIDFVSALPISVKMAGGTLKAVLKELLRPHLPKAIIDLRKKGFGPPSANWLRTVLRPTFESVFTHERMAAQGIFKPESIEKLAHEHMSRKRDHGRLLWLLLSFQLWYDHFIAAKA